MVGKVSRPWIAVIAVVAAAGLFFLLRPRPQFGEERFERIREGMMEDEVIALLGCPPGDYRPTIWSQPDWFVSSSDAVGFLRAERGRSYRELERSAQQDVEEWVKMGRPVPPPSARVQKKHWWGRGYGIEVAFDESCRLIHCSLWELVPPRPPPDMIRRVRWWLGW
jgi:hypothetical protein